MKDTHKALLGMTGAALLLAALMALASCDTHEGSGGDNGYVRAARAF
jgi:predicted small secreted protein